MIKISNDEWQTPKDLFHKLNEEFRFNLDVAATIENSLCEYYLTEEYDSVKTQWPYQKYTGACWMNPPYSRGNIDKFVKKAFEESQKGCTVVGLIPLVCSPKWFKEYVFGKAHEIRFISKRVRFINHNTGKQAGSPAFDSMIVVWKPGTPKETKFSYFDW